MLQESEQVEVFYVVCGLALSWSNMVGLGRLRSISLLKFRVGVYNP